MDSRVAENIRVISTPEDTSSSHECQVISTGRKRCFKCKDWKDRSGFYENRKSGSKDGLDCWCKDCRNKYSRQWQYDNREQISVTRKCWMTREKDTKYKARHRAKHRDRHYARSRLDNARRYKGLTLDHCSWPGCAETEKIEGHHPSYKKPHEIVSLCLLHHKAADLLGDKLGFDLPIIDIGIYFKKPRRVKPTVDTPQREGVAT